MIGRFGTRTRVPLLVRLLLKPSAARQAVHGEFQGLTIQYLGPDEKLIMPRKAPNFSLTLSEGNPILENWRDRTRPPSVTAIPAPHSHPTCGIPPNTSPSPHLR